MISHFDYFLDGILGINSQGQVVYCNQKMAESLGGSTVRISKSVPIDELLEIDGRKITINDFTSQDSDTQVLSQLVQFKSKYGSTGSAQIIFISYKDTEFDLIGLVYMKDLTHEFTLEKKYLSELKAKDKKILEMQILLELTSNSRFSKEPRLLVREFANHLITNFKLPWILLVPDKNNQINNETLSGKNIVNSDHIKQLIQKNEYDVIVPGRAITPYSEAKTSIVNKDYQCLHYDLGNTSSHKTNIFIPIDEQNPLSEDDLKLLNILAEQASLLLDNSSLQLLAITDELTQTFNVRYFKANLEAQIKYAKAHSEVFSLILLDIDHFKKINDTYGHLCGDFVLKAIGQLLRKESRNFDLPARYGGEEFAILLPKCSPQDAVQAAQRIRESVSKLKINYEDQVLNITASFGVSSFPQFGDNAEKLIAKADEALYRVKKAGRNQVELAQN